MDFGKVLSRAWQITWRWKVLWILGFLASLGRGIGGGGNFNYNMNGNDFRYRYENYVPPEVWAIIAGVVCLALFIGIALGVISIIARGGLIAGVQQVEEEGTTGFARAWRVGVKRFWTLFGISVLTVLPIIILVVIGIGILVLFILGVVGASSGSAGTGEALTIVTSVLCGGALCCGTILIAIVLGQIQVYADRAAVLEGLGWIDAFKRGWQVIKNNLGATIILWLVFVVIGMIFAIVIMGGIIAIAAPFIAIFSSGQPGPWLVVPICFGGLLAIIIGAFVNSIVETFTSTTWTLAYRELTGLVAKPEAEAVAA
jgi:hypothetical protein